MIEVTGNLSSISENTVRIDGKADGNWLTDVYVVLNAGQDDVIRQLCKGEKITVVGICKSTDITGDVKLERAKINKKKTTLNKSATSEKSTIATSEKTVETIEVSIDTILEDYKNNSVAADDKYKGKNLIITDGKIFAIEDGFVQIENSDAWDWNYIFAYYSDKNEVKNLSKGDYVTVSGICRGEALISGIKLTGTHFE